MPSHICIFEDEFYRQLLPLVYFRPVYDLRCGILTLREKILRATPKEEVILHCRGYLTDMVHRENPGVSVNNIDSKSCLFINGRVLADTISLKTFLSYDLENMVLVHGDSVVAAYVEGKLLASLKMKLGSVFSLSDFSGLQQKPVKVKLISHPWDLVYHNSEHLVADFKMLMKSNRGKKIKGKVYPGAVLLNKKDIFIDRGSAVKPGAVLDAEEGAIYIGKNARIFPQATVIGPAFIGDGTMVKVGAKIYGGTSFGEMCKIGGEVEGSIIHSHSNKQHDGFLGHSYLGKWVNLGADTNNSDLKNNYGNVKVTIDGQEINSGLMFVGLFMGDHSKSGINTMFNTGTVVGVSSNVFGSGFPPKYIPSFSWGGAHPLSRYDLEKSIDVAKRVMARRNVEFTDIDRKLFTTVFELTREERRKLGMQS